MEPYNGSEIEKLKRSIDAWVFEVKCRLYEHRKPEGDHVYDFNKCLKEGDTIGAACSAFKIHLENNNGR